MSTRERSLTAAGWLPCRVSCGNPSAARWPAVARWAVNCEVVPLRDGADLRGVPDGGLRLL